MADLKNILANLAGYYVRYELLWGILQKGVEFVNEQSDIFHMFNPDKRL